MTQRQPKCAGRNSNKLKTSAAQLWDDAQLGRPRGGWRLALYRVIFESDTRAGRSSICGCSC